MNYKILNIETNNVSQTYERLSREKQEMWVSIGFKEKLHRERTRQTVLINTLS